MGDQAASVVPALVVYGTPVRGRTLSWVLGVSTGLGCGASELLRVEAPSPEARSRVVIARSGTALSVHAIDGTEPLEIPGLRVEDGAPLELTTLSYADPADALDFQGAPGALTVVTPEQGLPLWPALRGERRTVTLDDDGAWAPISDLDPPLSVAPRPACRPLDAQPIALPAGLDVYALYTHDDTSATMVLEDRTRREWYRVADGASTLLPNPLPDLRVRAGAVGEDGTEWVAGVTTASVAELWSRPRGGTFVRVPLGPAAAAAPSPDGEVWWLAPLSQGGVWTMTRHGWVERYRGGQWDVSEGPPVPLPARGLGALTRVDDDHVVALLPFPFNAMERRYVARVSPAGASHLTFEDPLPHALVYADTFGAVVVGTVNGRVHLLGDRELEDIGRQSMGSMIAAIRPSRHGFWRGVVFAGLNGYLREQYVGAAETCVPTGLWFNVASLVQAGDGWVASGNTQPPGREPSLAFIRRR